MRRLTEPHDSGDTAASAFPVRASGCRGCGSTCGLAGCVICLGETWCARCLFGPRVEDDETHATLTLEG